MESSLVGRLPGNVEFTGIAVVHTDQKLTAPRDPYNQLGSAEPKTTATPRVDPSH